MLIWPVAVQGEKCAPEVAAAIRGFNALPEGGPVPRPDLIIVARGGGSIEDLWGFNEEAVVRAAAANLGREIAIMADLQGPKIRIGRFAGGKIMLEDGKPFTCLLYTSPSPRDRTRSRMPSSA